MERLFSEQQHMLSMLYTVTSPSLCLSH